MIYSADAEVVLGALMRDGQGTPANVAPEEHDDVGWYDLDELPPPAHELVRTALLRAVRNQPG